MKFCPSSTIFRFAKIFLISRYRDTSSSGFHQEEIVLSWFILIKGIEIAEVALSANPITEMRRLYVSISHARRRGRLDSAQCLSRTVASLKEGGASTLACGALHPPLKAFGTLSRKSWMVTALKYQARSIAPGCTIGRKGTFVGSIPS